MEKALKKDEVNALEENQVRTFWITAPEYVLKTRTNLKI